MYIYYAKWWPYWRLDLNKTETTMYKCTYSMPCGGHIGGWIWTKQKLQGTYKLYIMTYGGHIGGWIWTKQKVQCTYIVSCGGHIGGWIWTKQNVQCTYIMPCGGHIGGWSEQNEDLHGHQLSGNHILYLVYIHTCIFGENSVIFLPICNYYTPFYLYLIKSETTYIMYHDIHIQIGCWIRMKYGFFFFFFFFFFWGSLINHSKSNYSVMLKDN